LGLRLNQFSLLRQDPSREPSPLRSTHQHRKRIKSDPNLARSCLPIGVLEAFPGRDLVCGWFGTLHDSARTGAREASCADFGVGIWSFNPKPEWP